jgi:hypothetical protein
MKYAIEMSSNCMIYIPTFMKIDTGVQAILSKILSQGIIEAVMLVLLM